MKKILLAALSITATSSAFAVNCNLPNIAGQWGFTVTGQAGPIGVTQQCQLTIARVQGNAKQAAVTGACLDLITGYYGIVQPNSWVGFVGKSCQIQGQVVTTSAFGPYGTPFVGNMVANLNGQVATNKQSMSGTAYDAAIPAWFVYGPYTPIVGATTTPFSGNFTGNAGASMEPLDTIMSSPSLYSGYGWPYVVTGPVLNPAGPPSSNNGNGNGNGNGNSNNGHGHGNN